RIGVFVFAIRIAPLDENETLSVRCKREVPDLLAVILRVRGQRVSLVLRGRGHPDVPSAAIVEDPGDGASGRRRDQVGWERSRENLRERERPGCLGVSPGRSEDAEKNRSNRDASRHQSLRSRDIISSRWTELLDIRHPFSISSTGTETED